jgi:hypothetical protein
MSWIFEKLCQQFYSEAGQPDDSNFNGPFGALIEVMTASTNAFF